jgi:hypothetical protein
MRKKTNPLEGTDGFALSLLEESKRFLEKARSAPNDVGRNAFLHSSLLLAFCSLEAHVNAMAEDFASEMKLTAHELGVLKEREVRLENGKFQLKNTLKMVRLEDRIKFLCRRFSRKPVDFSAPWWSGLLNAMELRNALTHPKGQVLIDVSAVGCAIEAIIDTLDALYVAILLQPFPMVRLRLDSTVDF